MFETTNQLWLINAKICRASWVLLSLLNSRTWQLQVQNEHHDVHDENPCICKWTKNPWVTQLHTVSATSTALWEPFKPFIPRSFIMFFSEIKKVSNQESFFRPVALSIHWSVHSVAIEDHHPMRSHMFLLEKNLERLRRLRIVGVPP